LGKNAQDIAKQLDCDLVLYADHPMLADFIPDAYLDVLSSVISEHKPRAVLIGHTSIGMDIACGLSARLDLALVASVRSFQSDAKFVSQLCGGKIMVEGYLPDPTALITFVPGEYKPEQGQPSQPPAVTPLTIPALDHLQISLKRYIEPETGDIDISRAPIIIAVGRGIQTQDNISLAEELSEALGGVVCASRPVVDQGWLPTSRLVGKSGKVVKPKVYLALGISGAPEHTESITGSDTIIAFNTDPTAPIFNIAKYGINADLFDVVPVLTDHVNRAKNG
jgi:electron transfer flavoprotein alpha subunit